MTAIYKYKQAMRWFTRPKVDPSIKQLAASNPLNFPEHMIHQYEGGQLTPEEFYQHQSIPQSERPLTGAEGGRVQYKPGGLVEPGVTHYGDEKPWETKRHGVPRGTGTPEAAAIYARTTDAKKRLEAQKKGLVWDPKTKKMRKARKGGAPLGWESPRKGIVLTDPSKKQLEIAEKVYSKKFDSKKGLELWKAIGKDKRSSIIQKATTGETGGWKIPVPEGKIDQKELIEMLGEEYNKKMRRSIFSERVPGKKNYLVNKVADLLNRIEVPTKGKKVAYLWDRPTPDQLDFIRNYIDSPHLMDRTVKNMRILDKGFGEILSKAADTEIGKKFFRDTFTVDMAKEALTKAGVKDISDAKAARAMTRLGQSYQGKLFKNEIGIGENKKTGEFIINSFNELDQYHPWRQASYNAALDDLKSAVGSKAGNLLGFKQAFKELMQKRYKNRQFVFNEVFSISTSANRGSYPYAYFVDLTEHAMNKGALSTFQGQASIAEGKMQEAIRKYRKTGDIKHYNEAKRVKDVFNNSTRKLFLSSEKVKKYQKDYGIKPNALQLELGTAGQIKDRINFASNYYTTKNLNKWKDLGIDIDAHTGRSGYIKTFGKKDFVPKNVAVASELFTPETRFQKGAKKKIFDEKALNKFFENNKTIIEALGCPGKKAAGGRVGFQDGTNCFTKGQKKMNTLLMSGAGTQAERSLLARIIQGGAALMKGFGPKEMLKAQNLFGLPALGFMGAIEAGLIGDDVIRLNIPIKEALGKNWVTGVFMPRSGEGYQVDEMRKQGFLINPGAKTYAKGIELQDKYNQLAELLSDLEDPVSGFKAIEPKLAAELKVDSIADVRNEMEKIMKEYNEVTREGAAMEEGSGAQIEFMQDADEYEATQLAKTEYSPIFGELGTEALPPKTTERIGPRRMGVVKEELPIGQRRFDLPETYEKVSTSKTPIPEEGIRNMRDYLRYIGLLKPRDELPQGMVDFFQTQEKLKQDIKLPGMRGTQFNTGGRVGFKMGRRAFLGWLASLIGGAAGIKSGLIGFGKGIGKGETVIKAGDHIIQGTKGMPDWFIPLINRIVKEGDDVTKKLATKEREIVHSKKIEGHDVDVYQDLDTGNIRVEVEGGTGKNLTAYDEGLALEYKAGEVIEEGKYKGQKTDPEFSTTETEAGYVRTGPDDADLEIEGVKSFGTERWISDTNFLKNYATKKKPTMGEIVETTKKKKQIKHLNENPHEDPRIPEYTGPDDADDLFDEFGNYIGD